ncbi:trimethylamine methyltransferase family protein [Haloarculaceae archaeon H-GB11]|nr:trimethylamine methyltransferase family protein [Haloarculaceae archaeon H-GB11]
MTGDLSTQNVRDPGKLSDEGVRTIHEKSLEILSDIGISVESDEARDVLAEGGARIVDDELVELPPVWSRSASSGPPRRSPCTRAIPRTT